MRFFLLIAICLSSLLFYSQDFDTTSVGRINVKVSNIRSDSGDIYLFLYNYENQYPKTPYNFYKVSKKDLSDDGSVEFQIPTDLYYGKYALTLIDDENANELLDKNFGVPVEGYGFSNNEKPNLFFLPKYKELLIELSLKELTLEMEVQYLFD